MKTVCEKDLCNGCMACVDICPKHAVKVNPNARAYNAIIDEKKCINCNACHKVCPRNDAILELLKPIAWHQGWANNKKIRSHSTSGGAATAIIKFFLASGGYVCSCSFVDGAFRYKITNIMEDYGNFAGSKYVKSNPQGVYRQIAMLLKNGEKVLFIGLPCHVAAVKNYVGKKKSEKMYTIDLICHGTPAPVVLEKYLNDNGINIQKIENISFRSKKVLNNKECVHSIVHPGIADGYIFSFLKKINYTTNCYNCQFASLQRVSDLTLGDSWGSDLSDDEKKKGVSLFLVQNEKGLELVSMADVTLLPVNLNKAVASNAQLRKCADIPVERNAFFDLFEKGVLYNKILFKVFPKFFIKQMVKKILIKLRIFSVKNGVTYIISVKNEKKDNE